jgi:hypothetical protein
MDERAKADVSLDDVRDMIWAALQDKDKDAYLSQVYGGYLVYEKEGKHYRLSYSILDGKVQLGDQATEVEKVWVEVVSKQAEMDDVFADMIRLKQARDPQGTAWDVVICEPGFTLNGWYHPDEALREGASLFEGVDVNLYEMPHGATHVDDSLFPIKSLLVKNKAGWIDNVRHVAGKGIEGVLHLVDSFKWIGKNLLDGIKSGGAVYGLSYDAPVRASKSVIEGRPVMKLAKFLSVDSVDIVTRPAAGGKFIRAVASMQAQYQGGRIMDKKQLWDAILAKRPDLLKDKIFEKVTDDEVVGLARMAMEPEKKDSGSRIQDPEGKQFVTKEEMDIWRCEMALDETLKKSELPEHAQKRMRSLFKSRKFEQADLDKAIADEKDYLAKMTVATAGDPISGSGIRVGIGSVQKAQIAVDRMFNLTKDDMVKLAKMERLDHQPFFTDMRATQDFADYDKIPAFSGLREMYAFFTGDPEVTGQFNRKGLPPDLRANMDINSATFTFMLGNTLGRRLVKEYREFDYLESLVISIRKPVRDFRAQEAVLVGGFPDLAVVDPEVADYVEIAPVTDEEVSYNVGQFGNILTITRRTIINDDISIVQRVVRGLGRAARRTHGKYVWTMLINNWTCTDGTAMFTGAGAHLNLGAAALTHATALIAYQAIAAFTEKDSGERLGLLADRSIKLNLIGPIELMDEMGRIETEDLYYTANDLTTKIPNPLLNKVMAHTHPLLTDATDWYMLLPPTVVDIIEMGYLNGREEPEMFLADSPQAEQVFVADKIRHKIRHEYAGHTIDFRSGYKAVVAG